MLCVEAPEANILVCKGYKCTKNQAPNYIFLQNQVISSNNYQSSTQCLSVFNANAISVFNAMYISLQRNNILKKCSCIFNLHHVIRKGIAS